MEGRGFSDLVRSTTEEVLIKSMMDNPIGNMAPSMEMLGFKNIMQPFRTGNEELFNSSLINGEVPASAIAHRTQQAFMRISTDLCPSQQNATLFQEKSSNVNAYQNLRTINEDLNDPGQYSLRKLVEEGMQLGNIQMEKAWFCSSQPLTRSRPLELRRYAAMQAPHNIPEHDADRFKKDFTNMRNFCNIPIGEMPNHQQTFMSLSNSSTAFSTAPIATVDTVSSLVSMLKGTLEHKKLDGKVDNGTFEGGYYGMLTFEEAARCVSSIQGAGDQASFFHLLSPVSVPALGSIATIEKSLELNMDGFPTEVNQTQMGTVSQEPSQSDSSTAAPALSADFEVCDAPVQSGNTVTNCGNSGKHVGNGSSEHEYKPREFRERIFENSFKDSRKQESLARMDSISSGASVEKADPTKKRRVERSRKMAEAKERNSTSSLPSDIRAVLKQCENLEKEVRSLKLNLSFMNRKDSEQAKQIEELEKQNEELTEEKERLLEKRRQIVSEYGNF